MCVCGRGLRYNKHCVNNLTTSSLKELTELLVFVRSVMVTISTEHTLDKSHALYGEFEEAKLSCLSWEAYESRDVTAKGCRAASLLLASSVKNASESTSCLRLSSARAGRDGDLARAVARGMP